MKTKEEYEMGLPVFEINHKKHIMGENAGIYLPVITFSLLFLLLEFIGL